MSRLSGKVAVITGAASGIGVAVTRLFVDEGAKVAAIDVQAEALDEVCSALGSGVTPIAADVTNEAQMMRAMARAEEIFGGIDVLVANAGIFGVASPLEVSAIANFERVLQVNVTGTLITLKHAIPLLTRRGGGSVIITSSVAALIGNPGGVAYTASKHALTGIMRVAACELASRNIRANTVNPGPVDTPMMRVLEAEVCPENPPAGRAKLMAAGYLGSVVQPEEVAELILFLASDAAKNCTGGIYVMDGGAQYGGGVQ
jgi:NAD(P)-dependent dehydrogenase (short-subunit alcohol dehydrogenase family)